MRGCPIKTTGQTRTGGWSPADKAAKPQADSEYPLGANTLRHLYTYMLKWRMVDEQARTVLKLRKRLTGSEAVLVGATIGLRHDDHIAALEHGFIANIVRSRPLEQLFAEIRPGRQKRAGQRRDPRSATITPGAEFSIATGVALGFQIQKKHNVVIALALRSAGSPDFWHEPATFAGAHKLPIVFVVHARSEPSRLNSRAADLSAQAEKLGLPGIPVDANDAVAVYRVAHEAIDRARRGAGPALIECKTWTRGRTDDPIAHMQQYLQWKRLWSEDWGRQIAEGIRREIEDALRGRRSR